MSEKYPVSNPLPRPARPPQRRGATNPAQRLSVALLGLLGLLVSPREARSDAPQAALHLASTGLSPAPLRIRKPPRFAPLAPVSVAGRSYYPYSFDGHVHTRHSPDAEHPPLDVLAAAEAEQLDALIITDHGAVSAQASFGAYKGKLVPFVGQEVGGPYGHAVLWNVGERQDDATSNTSLAERAAFAHAHGGLIVLCHPGWWIAGRAEDPMKWMTAEALKHGGKSSDIDAVELWNGVYDGPLRKLIGAWEAGLEAGARVPIVGSSDFHRRGGHRLGGPRTVVYCDAPAPERCLWDAVKRGRAYVSDGPSLLLTVNDVLVGGEVSVPADGTLDVRVEAQSQQDGELRVLLGRRVVHVQPLAEAAPTRLRLSLPAPPADSYVRVEIVRPRPAREPALALLSNPVHVRRVR